MTLPAITHIQIARIIAGNLVPVVGVAFFGWPALNLLLLYGADIWLAIIAAFVIGLTYMSERLLPALQDKVPPLTLGKLIPMAVFYATVVSLLLAVPMALVVVGTDTSWSKHLVIDAHFLWALLTHILLAASMAVEAYLRIRAQPSSAGGVKARYGFVFVRWFALLLLAVGCGILPLGAWSATVLVAGYAVVTIWMELWPGDLARRLNIADVVDPDRSLMPSDEAIKSLFEKAESRRRH
jgi:hypothetical protein